ncbi:hypothetical protein [Streptomyces sp. NPDC051000]|uniref:hypothetical protein n=1 Tax=Streptomyces sp. NPDC051000 TaxID=3155520 RepID=UPI0033D137D2
MLVAPGLQGGAGVSVVVRVGMTFSTKRMMLRAMPSTAVVGQGGQQDAPDLVQGEGVRVRLSVAQDPRGGAC